MAIPKPLRYLLNLRDDESTNQSIFSLFNPIYGMGYAFTILANLIKHGIIKVDDPNFMLNMLSTPILVVMISFGLFLSFLKFNNKFEKSEGRFRTFALITLPASEQYVHFLAYFFGLLNIWFALIIVQSPTSVDSFWFTAFSIWTAFFQWHLNQLIIGVDGKSGAINKFVSFLKRRFPRIARFDEKLTYESVLLICRIRPPIRFARCS